MRRKKRPSRRLNRNVVLRRNAVNKVALYKQGLDEGYQQGLSAGLGSYQANFEGTSIIIPCENEIESVLACIEGIMDHTHLPYEIIVIDNGSKDGTENFLRQLDGQVRYRILAESVGYTGSINKGMMMAKGTSILLLSNDMRPTENWLENLLLCLYSDNRFGLVGPVSNGLSGDQKMVLPYNETEELHEHARLNNRSHSSSWLQTEQLSSRCLLFRRELLERVGYFDEGFKEMPFEADDYGIRAKLQGYALVCARDAYVHNDRVESDLAERNLGKAELSNTKRYFKNKWGDLDIVFLGRKAIVYSRQVSLPDEDNQTKLSLGEAIFYPQQMVVKGFGDTIYWIEHNIRRPIQGHWDEAVIRLSQLDIWRYSKGDPISVDTIFTYRTISSSNGNNEFRNGCLYVTEDGSRYYMENGRKRAIMSKHAAECWGLQAKLEKLVSENELKRIPDGMPIIAPITLYQAL